MDYKTATDENLAALAQQSDECATETLLYRYKDKVRGVSRGFFLVGGDGEDLVQEGMIGLYKAIRDYSSDRCASFKTYASICIKGQIQDAIKTANRKKHKFLNDAVSLYSKICDEDGDGGEFIERLHNDNTSNPEDKLLEAENSNDFYAALLKAFKPDELKILSLFLKGLSYEAIAKEVGVSTKKVDNTLVKIRKTLTKTL